MVITSASLPAGASEVEAAKLNMTPSISIKPPRITESSVALECVEHSTIEIGANRLVLGIVMHIHLADGLCDPKSFRIDQRKWTPIGRMGSPDWYCRTDELFEIARPD